MQKKLPEPITKKTFENMVAKWAQIAKYHECGSIYHYCKSGLLRRFNQLLANKPLFKKYFKNINIKIIDLESTIIEDVQDLGILNTENTGCFFYNRRRQNLA
jgi:hypothetical protein